MPSALVQVTDLDTLKKYLGIAAGDTSEDDMLSGLILQCDQVTKTWLRITSWNPETEYTEYYDGNNAPVFTLRQRPVIEIEDLWVDLQAHSGQGDDDFDGDPLVVGQDYWLKYDMPDGSNVSWTGRVYRSNGVWTPTWVYPKGLLTPVIQPARGTIKVTYNAGWPDGVPPDITLAANNCIAAFRAGSNYGKALNGISYKGFSAQFGDTAKGFFTTEMKDLLATYRRLLR